jgi:hypothetical protein
MVRKGAKLMRVRTDIGDIEESLRRVPEEYPKNQVEKSSKAKKQTCCR